MLNATPLPVEPAPPVEVKPWPSSSFPRSGCLSRSRHKPLPIAPKAPAATAAPKRQTATRPAGPSKQERLIKLATEDHGLTALPVDQVSSLATQAGSRSRACTQQPPAACSSTTLARCRTGAQSDQSSLSSSWPWLVGLLGLCCCTIALTRFLPREPRPRSMRMRLHFRHAARPWLRDDLRAMAAVRPVRDVAPVAADPARAVGVAACPPPGRAQRTPRPRSAAPRPAIDSLEEHAALIAAPRTGKTLMLGAMLIRHPGPAVATSSKVDVVQATSAVRAKQGPVETLNPARLGGIASTVRFNVIAGAEDPAVAVRRADAFSSAVSMKGSENGDYFAGKCSSYLRAMFLAAAIVGGDMRLVATVGTR